MKKISIIVIVAVLCLLNIRLMEKDGTACTAFLLKHGDDLFVGKNFDWMVADAHVIVNKRGVSKTAIQTFFDRNPVTEEPLGWTSRFGSVTFNQFGREWPFGGMNEAGLIVEGLALADSESPRPDNRPSISAFQLIQFYLDRFETVEDVIASRATLRIRPSRAPAGHLFVTDKKGNSVVIEFMGGKQIHYSKQSLPHKVLTNSPYADSIAFLKNDRLPWRDKSKSIERFIRTSKTVKRYRPEASNSPLDDAFNMLEDVQWRVERGFGALKFVIETKWSVVYDVKRLQIHFRTRENPKRRIIHMRGFDFSCAAPVKVLNIHARLSGDVTDRFVDYTHQINRNLIESSFEQTPYPVFYGFNQEFVFHLIKSGFSEYNEIPVEAVDTLSSFPETTVCEKQSSVL